MVSLFHLMLRRWLIDSDATIVLFSFDVLSAQNSSAPRTFLAFDVFRFARFARFFFFFFFLEYNCEICCSLDAFIVELVSSSSFQFVFCILRDKGDLSRKMRNIN